MLIHHKSGWDGYFRKSFELPDGLGRLLASDQSKITSTDFL